MSGPVASANMTRTVQCQQGHTFDVTHQALPYRCSVVVNGRACLAPAVHLGSVSSSAIRSMEPTEHHHGARFGLGLR